MSAQAIDVRPDRRKFIGGSDVAAILGVSPWKTLVQLWADKTKPPSEEPERPRKQLLRGKRWEGVVAEMLTESLRQEGMDVEVVAANRRYPDAQHPMFACEIDFELRLNGAEEITNCELKTVHPFKAKEWGDQGTDDVPVWYTAQAMWGLGITGRKSCIVAALFGADELKPYLIERDDALIAAMREKALAFWNNHVLTGIAPDPLTLTDVNMLFAKDGEAPALIADEDLTEKYLRLRAIEHEIKARQAEYALLEFDVKRIMRDCTEVVVGDKVGFVWKNRATSWLDQSALKEHDPKLVKAFTRKGTARVFTVK
ncbi:MAG: hypothetical protein HMLKMBBP_01526 [Planctomycetes bacterium]|nr:hypothetical protein [Planctomycetota bacterium]